MTMCEKLTSLCGGLRCTYKILLGKLGRQRPSGRPRNKYEDIISNMMIINRNVKA
jgi:hypothetical protein